MRKVDWNAWHLLLKDLCIGYPMKENDLNLYLKLF